MAEDVVAPAIIKLIVAGLLGFLVGLEREVGKTGQRHAELRDFVLVSLLGAISGGVGIMLDSPWVMVAGFLGALAIVISGYWAAYLGVEPRETGITTELALLLTFFVGVVVALDHEGVAVAIVILALVTLSKREQFRALRGATRKFELDAAVQLLVISFIVLPLLPRVSLDEYLTVPMGTVEEASESNQSITVELQKGRHYDVGDKVQIYDAQRRGLGSIEITSATEFRVVGGYTGEGLHRIRAPDELRSELGLRFLTVVLSAITPYNIWLIVVLVSFISFMGYVLTKALGSQAGIGLTGLVGGLASSTVTTLSFARRSKEAPNWNRYFAVAVILASSIMFPRLLVQISVVNVELMQRMALPVLVMGGTGLAIGGYLFLGSQREKVEGGELELTNPFSLKSAVGFALVLGSVMIVTRIGIEYLGGAWLPVIAIVSGLTDADAIAFSVSNAQQAGLITLDWAAFNAVLGAIANTAMKLFLVFGLGHRGLFKQLLAVFAIIGIVGIATTLLYYDLSAGMAAPS